MNRKHPVAAAVAALWITAVPGLAVAAPQADLRGLFAQADWTSRPDDATLRYTDWFNNNDPQSGAVYSGGLVAPSPLYTVTGSVTGAETTPGDYTVGGDAVGQMRFTKANGSTPVVLNVNGVLFSNSVNRIRMNGPTFNGSPSTLFHAGRDNFAASSAWDFSTPDVGMRYGMRFTDANIGADGFDDLISLDVVNSGGIAALQLRRIAGSEATGVITITQTENRSFASGLYQGYTLADVNFLVLHMYWYGDTKQIEAEVEMLRVADGGNSIDEVGEINFTNRYTIFNGPDTFTRMEVGANWSEEVRPPIPEPSSWALMALGLAGLGVAARRRNPR